MATLQAASYEDFAQACELLVGSDEIGRVIRRVGKAADASETAQDFEYGFWRFTLSAAMPTPA